MKAKVRQLLKIRESKARLETAAEEKARVIAREREEREKETGRPSARRPRALEGKPEDRAQSNFTDPESRIMKTGNGYEQSYNGQLAVDSAHQVIVAHDVTNKQNDVAELLPMVDQTQANTGELPKEVSADHGYCSESNLNGLETRGVHGYVATGRQKHGQSSATNERDVSRLPFTSAMRRRLRCGGFRSR